MIELIPIFPLRLVVFPNSKYHLHIFEPRYKKMIKDCLERDSGFGIVASFDNKISDVGVYVKISHLLKKYENGEMDIVVKGIKRFLINDTKLHTDGYYISNVEEYKDSTTIIDFSLVKKLQSEFEEIIELANYKLDEKYWNQLTKCKLKSYKIAEKAGLDYEKQQELLILKNENARLNYLINHFIHIKNKLSKSKSIKNIILNDGYLN